jgi:hypothetical protein
LKTTSSFNKIEISTFTPKFFTLKKSFLVVFLFAGLVILSLNQCKKDSLVNGTGISFSTDTLTFDTVFTSLGSTTRSFLIYNTTSKPISISNIKLMGLQGNQFRINVDGVSGTSFNNVEVLAKDSMFVFVEVTVNPNNVNNPYVITDEVQFLVKNQVQKVVLEAWGQDAYYHLGTRYSTSNPPPVWKTDKPHIILSRRDSFPGLEVQEGVTLNIPSGTRIYMGPGALISVDGTLNAIANCNDSITFEGIRLEHYYDNRPGQWLGIFYGRKPTTAVNLTRCVINESGYGLADEHLLNVLVGTRITTSKLADYGASVKPRITLNKTVIKNTAGTALTAIYSELKATNCLFCNTGGNAAGLFLGGDYTFTHCTMANVYAKYVDHKSESLVATDQIKDIDDAIYNGAPLTANFINCVVYGTLTNEFAFVTANPSAQINFTNCLVKAEQDTFSKVNAVNCQLNLDPQFKKPNNWDFMPDTGSPLLNSGVSSSVTDDLYCRVRSGSPPTIGAIEKE